MYSVYLTNHRYSLQDTFERFGEAQSRATRTCFEYQVYRGEELVFSGGPFGSRWHVEPIVDAEASL